MKTISELISTLTTGTADADGREPSTRYVFGTLRRRFYLPPKLSYDLVRLNMQADRRGVAVRLLQRMAETCSSITEYQTFVTQLINERA
jgi:hypothetical protein